MTCRPVTKQKHYGRSGGTCIPQWWSEAEHETGRAWTQNMYPSMTPMPSDLITSPLPNLSFCHYVIPSKGQSIG